ncbi:MAG: T9SS type A sorting domain-containing protein [Bacteroidetes bacterium]|nr:MAG: T9SS type A sorting domain-containing protein [Bacteroidota bacterium]
MKKLYVTLVFASCAFNMVAQTANTLRDTDFTLNFGSVFGAVAFDINEFPYTESLPLSNGKVLLYGHFRSTFDTDISGIVRLNADGSRDESFQPPVAADGYSLDVNCAYELPDGKLLIGGTFTNSDQNAPKGLLKLNTDGSIDNTFNHPFTSFSPTINGIDVQSDGKIVIVGAYAAVGVGTGITRLNADGTVDTSFDPGQWASGVPVVSGITVLPNGKMIVSGFFTSWNDGTTSNSVSGLVALNSDGSYDPSFSYTGSVSSTSILPKTYPRVALQSDGKVVVAGITSNSNYAIRRYNADLTADNTFYAATNASESGVFPTGLAVQEDDRIVVAGYFLNDYDGNDISGIMRLNADGTLDPTFDAAEGFGSAPLVYHCALATNGNIYVVHENSAYQAEGLNPSDGFTTRQVLIRLQGDPVTTSIAQIDQASFSLYPNPVADLLMLEGVENGSTISIADARGAVVYQTTVLTDKTNVDVSSYEPGVYMISVQNGNSLTSGRFVKL